VAGHFYDFTRFKTGGADSDLFYRSVDIGPNSLKIRIPAPFADIVRMRYRITEHRLFPAYFAYFCHIFYLPKNLDNYNNQYTQKSKRIFDAVGVIIGKISKKTAFFQ